MLRYVPEMFKGDFAESEAEADAWVKGERKKNRRPPELLTRDVVSKAITREIAEGRGTPHGGVFLDIASKQSPEYIKQKLPSMYHQFKELAHIDITKDAMEIGPTTHYVMGGVKVDAETQESTVSGLFAVREFNPGWHTAIDLRSLLIVSEATARAALERTESRGAHTRSDYPDSDERQAREQIVIKKEGDRMAVRREAQPPLPADLMKLVKEGA